MSESLNLDLNLDYDFLETDISDSSNAIDSLNSNCRYIDEGELSKFFTHSNCSPINILHINCRSLNKNFSSIKQLLNTIDCKLSCLAVTETWLNCESEKYVSLPGYNFVSKTRLDKVGGGVGLYINDCFNYIVREDISRMTSFIECVFIEIIQIGQRNIILGCFYRPPNSDLALFNSDMLTILTVLSSERDKVLVVACDSNLDLLKASNHAPTSEFLNQMLCHSLYPAINKPTRITEHSATLIDNIFTNCLPDKIDSCIIYNDISDHLPVVARIEINCVKQKTSRVIKHRIFDHISIDNFISSLNSKSWEDVYNIVNNEHDVNKAYNSFLYSYKILFDQHFPEKTIKQSYSMTPRQKWMTKGLMKACITKAKLYKKYLKSHTDESKAKYVTYRNKLKSVLHKAENNYYREQFALLSGNLKATWKLLGTVINNNKSSCIGDSFIIDGVETKDKKAIVNKFNDFFYKYRQ